MLTITENARTVVEDLTTAAALPDGAGLRIAANESGALELALVPTPEPGDAVVEQGEARVFVERDTAASLEDLSLDTDLTGPEPAFVLVPQR